MHEVARRLMGKDVAGHTLQPTALLHEAWLRLLRKPGLLGRLGDGELLVLGARIMRGLLVDCLRRREAVDRQLLEVAARSEGRRDETHAWSILDLHEALSRLRQVCPRQARLVDLRFFADLTLDEAAVALGVSGRTAARDWRVARAFLMLMLRS